MAANPAQLRAPRGHGELAVFDLDGTLTRRDTLLPFLRYVSGTWRFLLCAARAMPALAGFALGLRTRTEAKTGVLKAFLGGMSRAVLERRATAFARERMPWMMRPQALERLAWHRARGDRCALVSASPAVYVEPWARAAGFDDVIATELEYDAAGRLTGRFVGDNCRGEEKVRRLEEYYGSLQRFRIHGYGDSPADRIFLGRCSEAHYRPFRDKAEAKRETRNHPADLLRLMRPHQWVKNSFVFVGLLFGHAWNIPELVAAALLAAIGFSLTASAIYIVNDFADRDRDRLHPKKRNRPLASGRVTPGAALALAAVLAVSGAIAAAAASGEVLSLVTLYAAMNIAYSFALKNVVILDVFIIAAGFILRILAGTLGIGVPPSQWLIVCSLLLTLFLGFTKRRSEMLSLSADYLTHRKALLHYNAALLDKLIGICACGAIMSYSLYTMSSETARLHGTTNLIYTIPFVIYAMFRYLYLLHAKHVGTDTSRELVRDPHLIVAVAGWCAATLWLIS